MCAGRDFRRSRLRKRLIQIGEFVTRQSLPMPRSLKSAWTAFALYLALSWTIFGARPRRSFFRSIDRPRTRPGTVRLFSGLVALRRDQPFESVSWLTSRGRPMDSIWRGAPSFLWLEFSRLRSRNGLGVVAAYNASMLLCPALSALTAFILCRRICGRFWPALAGGYVFGFSAYMLSHMLGHLTLVMEFFPPLAVYLVMRRIDDDLSVGRFTILLALVLIGQLGSSLEILATMTIFGGVALLVRWYLGDRELRARIVALGIPITCAYVIAALFASPYLYYFFVSGPPGIGDQPGYDRRRDASQSRSALSGQRARNLALDAVRYRQGRTSTRPPATSACRCCCWYGRWRVRDGATLKRSSLS